MAWQWILAGVAIFMALVLGVVYLVVRIAKNRRHDGPGPGVSLNYADDLERQRILIGLEAKRLNDQQRRYDDAQAAANGAIAAIETNDAERMASQLTRAGVSLQRPNKATVSVS